MKAHAVVVVAVVVATGTNRVKAKPVSRVNRSTRQRSTHRGNSRFQTRRNWPPTSRTAKRLQAPTTQSAMAAAVAVGATVPVANGVPTKARQQRTM